MILFTTIARRRWLTAQLRRATDAIRAIAQKYAAEFCRFVGLDAAANPTRWHVFMARACMRAQSYRAALAALEARP